MSAPTSSLSDSTPQLLLEHHLKHLRLPTILREYDKVARQCAAESVDYPRYLLRITELELLDRIRRATERRIRQERFPVIKSLDSANLLNHTNVTAVNTILASGTVGQPVAAETARRVELGMRFAF